MPQASERLQNLPPYVFSVIGDRLRQMQLQGIDVIRLDIGNPDMPPPQEVIDTLSHSANDATHHGYTGYRGVSHFREAIAEYYHNRFGVSLHPDKQVLPLLGSKEGIVNLALAYLSDGDIALIPEVGYPAYEMGTRLAGGEIHCFPLDPDREFRPVVEHLSSDVLSRAKLMWVNYPNNPTGGTISLDTFRELAAFCKQNDILLASDNPYMDVVFDGYEAPSALQATDDLSHVVEFFSFSKSFNMAGWRLGVALGSEEAIKNLLGIKSNIDSGHFHPIYDAGMIALATPQEWIDERNAIYKRRRDYLLSVLPAIGLEADVPKGSLYLWARTTEMDASEYIEKALSVAHVSLAPGEAYGPGGKGYIRMSVGTPDADLEQAVERLQKWYQG